MRSAVGNTVRRLFGQEASTPAGDGGDERAALERKVARCRAAIAAASDRIAELETQRHEAASYAEAQSIEQQLAEARWDRDRAAAELPKLEADVLAAKDAALDHEWRYHHFPELLQLAQAYAGSGRRAKADFDRFVSALGNARAAGFERDALVFMGIAPAIGANTPILADDLLGVFEAALARLRDSGPARRALRAQAPTAQRRSTAEVNAELAALPRTEHRDAVTRTIGEGKLDDRPAGSLQHVIRADDPGAPVAQRARNPDDLSLLAPGEARVRVQRPGFPDSDGRQCDGGQVIKLAAQTAEIAARNGAVEIIEVAGGEPAAAAISTEKAAQ